jgi:hypothetical protein
MASHGASLTQSLLMAVADSCPRQLARPLAGLLYALLISPTWRPAAVAWLAAALQSPAFTGEGVCVHVCSRSVAANGQRFVALMSHHHVCIIMYDACTEAMIEERCANSVVQRSFPA